MPTDPYVTGMVTSNAYRAKAPVTGRICAVLELRYDRRGLELIPQPSRVVRTGDVHELFVTDEAGAAPGRVVDRATVLGFFEAIQGGVVRAGDRVTIDGREIGTVVGFDETHAPNHLNIVVGAPSLATGVDLGLDLGMVITFTMNGQNG